MKTFMILAFALLLSACGTGEVKKSEFPSYVHSRYMVTNPEMIKTSLDGVEAIVYDVDIVSKETMTKFKNGNGTISIRIPDSKWGIKGSSELNTQLEHVILTSDDAHQAYIKMYLFMEENFYLNDHTLKVMMVTLGSFFYISSNA